MKLHVVYSKDAPATADDSALEYAQSEVDRIKGTSQELQVNTSSQIVVNAFRVLVKRGVISHEDILFYNRTPSSNPIRCNKNGRLNERPDGFCCTYDNFLSELI